MCACRVSHVLSADDCGDFAHVRASSCDSADLKIVSKIVICDLQKSNFPLLAGHEREGCQTSVCRVTSHP